MAWGDQIVTAPTERVVSIDEARRFLRVDAAESDVDITRLIEVATLRCQSLTRRQFMPATRRMTVNRFPSCGVLDIPWAPLRWVSSVRYCAGGGWQFMSASDFVTVLDTEPGQIYLVDGASWPLTDALAGAVQIEYDCGYESAELVPEAIRQAVLMTIAHYYEQRTELSVGTMKPAEFAALHLLEPYVVGDEFVQYG